VPSYLDDTFLGGAEDGNYEIGAADNLPAVRQDQQLVPVADTITLPGGIVIPKKTAIVIAIVIALAIWWLMKKRKKSED
jgi:hypothetical protein